MTNLAFNVRPFAEHVPDSGPDSEHKNPATVEAGAGMLELGFYVGDTYHPFLDDQQPPVAHDHGRDGDNGLPEPAFLVAHVRIRPCRR